MSEYDRYATDRAYSKLMELDNNLVIKDYTIELDGYVFNFMHLNLRDAFDEAYIIFKVRKEVKAKLDEYGLKEK